MLRTTVNTVAMARTSCPYLRAYIIFRTQYGVLKYEYIWVFGYIVGPDYYGMAPCNRNLRSGNLEAAVNLCALLW